MLGKRFICCNADSEKRRTSSYLQMDGAPGVSRFLEARSDFLGASRKLSAF
jgi:hypothetical protein